jgi:hypothetical protein
MNAMTNPVQIRVTPVSGSEGAVQVERGARSQQTVFLPHSNLLAEFSDLGPPHSA